MLCVSQAFLSQLFSKKQMLPHAVGAGRRRIKGLMYVLKYCPSTLSTLTQATKKARHLVRGKAA